MQDTPTRRYAPTSPQGGGGPLASTVSFSFGDSPTMADELLGLVLEGKKTATCGPLRDFPEGSEARPVVGRRDIVLDGKGRPAALIETLEVTIRRFDEMDEQFAHDEGEGLRTLDAWRAGHQDYFERNGGFSPDMELLCERFKLIEALEPTLPHVGRVANEVSGVGVSHLSPPPGNDFALGTAESVTQGNHPPHKG